ncbi:hypothetical protein A0H81_11134 [Grifola frondosa]|uniref:Uncharacterized protein n=1 Tax=Grifola frondosa TaxID=5627 RepID=A0A1C7LW47_GRIFR|nr:hypothetical protein A0H81_11134 [Grifola frondosa]
MYLSLISINYPFSRLAPNILTFHVVEVNVSIQEFYKTNHRALRDFHDYAEQAGLLDSLNNCTMEMIKDIN